MATIGALRSTSTRVGSDRRSMHRASSCEQRPHPVACSATLDDSVRLLICCNGVPEQERAPNREVR
jgi:hypothetical protein